jgi:hypothetical protein
MTLFLISFSLVKSCHNTLLNYYMQIVEECQGDIYLITVTYIVKLICFWSYFLLIKNVQHLISPQ